MNAKNMYTLLLTTGLLLASCNEETVGDAEKESDVQTESETVSSAVPFSEQDYRDYLEYMMELERSITVNYEFSYEVIDYLEEDESFMINNRLHNLIKDIRGNAFKNFTLSEESVFPKEFEKYHILMTNTLGKISRGAMLVDNIFLEQDMKWMSEATTTLDDGLKNLDEAIVIREEVTESVLKGVDDF